MNKWGERKRKRERCVLVSEGVDEWLGSGGEERGRTEKGDDHAKGLLLAVPLEQPPPAPLLAHQRLLDPHTGTRGDESEGIGALRGSEDDL